MITILLFRRLPRSNNQRTFLFDRQHSQNSRQNMTWHFYARELA